MHQTFVLRFFIRRILSCFTLFLGLVKNLFSLKIGKLYRIAECALPVLLRSVGIETGHDSYRLALCTMWPTTQRRTLLVIGPKRSTISSACVFLPDNSEKIVRRKINFEFIFFLFHTHCRKLTFTYKINGKDKPQLEFVDVCSVRWIRVRSCKNGLVWTVNGAKFDNIDCHILLAKILYLPLAGKLLFHVKAFINNSLRMWTKSDAWQRNYYNLYSKFSNRN